MAVSANLSWYSGDSVVINDSIVKADGSAEDITGWSLTFTVKQQVGSTALVTKSVGSGITITSGPAGTLQVLLTAADTLMTTPGSYIWDLRRTDAGSEVTLNVGSVSVPGIA